MVVLILVIMMDFSIPINGIFFNERKLSEMMMQMMLMILVVRVVMTGFVIIDNG